MIRTSAPGKIVLSGEYAVLDGAPAVCMAVDRRAHVAVTSGAADCHVVVAPGYSEIEGRFTSTRGRIRWRQGKEDYRLVDALWRTMRPQTDVNLLLMLDTTDFYEPQSGTKIGVGSSAALTVALAHALGAYLSSAHDPAGAAAAAHQQMQGGRGSGVDVACSLAGGIIEFRVGKPASAAIEWPTGLAWAALWSGVAASTRDRLSRLQETHARPSRATLAAEAEHAAKAWRSGDAAALLRQYRGYCAALRQFSADHGLGIYDAGHDEVAAAAESARLVYKPCGAGGGDIGIVLGRDVDTVNRFADDTRKFGFHRIDIGTDANGVTVDD